MKIMIITVLVIIIIISIIFLICALKISHMTDEKETK